MLVSLGVVIMLFGVGSCGTFVADVASWDPHGELHFASLGIGSFSLVVGLVLVVVGRKQRKA